MDIFTFIAITAVAVFVYILFFKNKKAAQKEINSLEQVNYKSKSSIKFDDVAGNYEAKESLKELVDFIKNPEKYSKFNARAPKGVLLYGSPGTGKTLLAQALAGEAEVDFFAVSGSDFVQVYAGLGASRIRNIFSKAKKAQKSVIFIDEIDAIGKKRLGAGAKGSDEGDRTLNALLTEMSGFENSGTIVVAATNRIDTLDEALLRPGRFDRQIEIMLPDRQARKDIIKLYIDKTKADKDVDIDKLSEMTVYFSGAMIENMVNEASILAVKSESDHICQGHIERAYFNVIAGADKKNFVSSSAQKKLTAYHEAGHAIMSMLLTPDNRLVRISIIPTVKGAGGYTLSIPKEENIISKEKIENQIRVFFAGRAAEEIVFGKSKITSGAYDDIEKATRMASDYVVKYGMSDEAGVINYAVLSEICSENLDANKLIKELMGKLYLDTKIVLEENIGKLNLLAERLLENETIDADEIESIMKK